MVGMYGAKTKEGKELESIFKNMEEKEKFRKKIIGSLEKKHEKKKITKEWKKKNLPRHEGIKKIFRL